MGIWSNYCVAHSAAVFEVLLHNSPPPHHVHVGPALSFKVTDLRAEGDPPPPTPLFLLPQQTTHRNTR